MKKLLVVLVVGLLIGSANAALEVGVGKTYSTIQAAVDAAVNGSEIIIYEGVYTETVTITAKNNMNVYANPGDKVVINGALNLYNASSATWSDNNTFKGLWIDRSGFTSGWAVQHQYARSNTYENCVFFGDNSGSNGIYGSLEYGLNIARHSTFFGLAVPYSHGWASGLHVFDSIVAFNGAQSYNYPGYAGVATYSNYYKNPVDAGLPTNVGSTTGTINLDPLFFSTDPSNPYFLHLGPNSPCNLSAEDGENMGALPTVPEPMSLLLLSVGLLTLRKRF